MGNDDHEKNRSTTRVINEKSLHLPYYTFTTTKITFIGEKFVSYLFQHFVVWKLMKRVKTVIFPQRLLEYSTRTVCTICELQDGSYLNFR